MEGIGCYLCEECGVCILVFIVCLWYWYFVRIDFVGFMWVSKGIYRVVFVVFIYSVLLFVVVVVKLRGYCVVRRVGGWS